MLIYPLFGQILTSKVFNVLYLTDINNDIRFKAENMRNAFHKFPWYICDENIKKMYNIVQIRMNKPIYLTANKFFIMDLETYLSVS